VKKTAFLFLLIWFSASYSHAENDSIHLEVAPASVDTNAVLSYFASKGIILDSCSNQQLYFEIYNWIGTPYRYAGKSKKGIDCSGFSNKIYESVYGSSLLGSSRSIYKATEPIKRTEAQEGDLVFFKINKKNISHIGIYLQNGKFAHASSSRGVIISDLSESYYKKYFHKVGKLNPQNEL